MVLFIPVSGVIKVFVHIASHDCENCYFRPSLMVYGRLVDKTHVPDPGFEVGLQITIK
jgi:hypothetical protein